MATRHGVFQDKKSFSLTINIPANTSNYSQNLGYVVPANRFSVIYAKSSFNGYIGASPFLNSSYGIFPGRMGLEESALSPSGPFGVTILTAGKVLTFMGGHSLSPQSMLVSYDVVEFALHSDI